MKLLYNILFFVKIIDRPPNSGSAPAQPPPGVDQQLYFWFQAVDTDKSGALTTEELQKALINGTHSK